MMSDRNNNERTKDMTREDKLARALQMCLNQMAGGRPADPRDARRWDVAVVAAQNALRFNQPDCAPLRDDALTV